MITPTMRPSLLHRDELQPLLRSSDDACHFDGARWPPMPTRFRLALQAGDRAKCPSSAYDLRHRLYAMMA